MSRTLVATLCAGLVLATGPGASGTPRIGPSRGSQTAPASAYSAPLATPLFVVRPFLPPPGPYAAGHRGVDLATAPGQVVLAAADGQVRFAGLVAGRGVVVIEHPDGVLSEYEPLTPGVSAGGRVLRGQAIGRVSGDHGGCAPSRCLHWGARHGGGYFDPMTLLGGLGPVRLLPWSPAAG